MNLDDLLKSYREASRTERDKGTYFERLSVAFLENDPVQSEQYEDIKTFKEWANWYGWSGSDTGIDLVAKIKGEEGFAAIQCKFYKADHRMAKADIDSFISASAKEPFRRRVIMDTTEKSWSENAETMLRGQNVPTIRIGLNELRESAIIWSEFAATGEVKLNDKKTLRPHQAEALNDIRAGLAAADRGKMIMACGTGKTFTSLKIAEDLTGVGKSVLYLVPSLALMAQTVREWTTDTETPLRSFAVCSDTQVGKRRVSQNDVAEIDVLDLAFPATTNAELLANGVALDAPEKMTVVFATYQSIQVISDAQSKYDLTEFDFIICDEAHRTTGATLDGDDESNFVKVHSNDNVAGKKRLYMTATPRIFGENVKSKAKDVDAELASMDDPEKYGETLFYRGFSWAVQKNLLTDYKVIVLAMDENLVSRAIQKRFEDSGSELVLDDATKIIGCYKALTKTDFKADVATDANPMRRGLAFCKDIRSSKLIEKEFADVVSEYLTYEDEISDAPMLNCEIEHVDGTFKAKERGRLLEWLKAESSEETCRILTNARCLSEGVDVPALDAIMFLHPRKSQIDIVQSVGRVMRKTDTKKMGYVILPVGVPAGVPPEEALRDNEKYKVVWQILNALRAHDDRFDATINKASLGQDISDQIEIVGITSQELQAVTAVVEDLPVKPASAKKSNIGSEGGEGGNKGPAQLEMAFSVDEFSRAIMAKIVKKCGTREYWENWAGNIAEIAQTHVTRLEALLKEAGNNTRVAFDKFLEELRDDLNESITEDDAIEMLAQHIITRPVFEILFEGHQFTTENPVSRAMQGVLDVLQEANLDKESKDLEKFYASVKLRAEGITDPSAKQQLIVQIYDNFFAKAFPRLKDKLGIVYTPVEIVDFIIHSVNEVLKDNFGQTLGSKGVHIIDPFTGTGTFVTRLLQSGLIKPEEMENKFKNEIHANEIVLLAYYIAAINIEAVYHGIMGGAYIPFEGICLTDTFQMYEKDDLISHYMPDNSERRKRQKATDIRVIVGNPPYSSGQRSANDNAENVSYPHLDERISETYAAHSNANLKNALYNSYIRAIRWASDRVGDAGVMAFVSGSAWVERSFADGMRKCLADEFSDLFVFQLRGDIRKNMLSKGVAGEGQNVFGSGSMNGISIAVLVKNPEATKLGNIYYHDIGDDLGEQEKLSIIKDFKSINGISNANGWQKIIPDEKNDWVDQIDKSFEKHLLIGDKRKNEETLIFTDFSNGLKTQRDPWAYNFSKKNLLENMNRMMASYNQAVETLSGTTISEIKKSVDYDPRKISWSDHLFTRVKRGIKASEKSGLPKISLYKPFTSSWAFYSNHFNDRRGQLSRIFPNSETKNLIIQVSGVGARAGFSVLMSNRMPALDTIEKGQCFPLYLYEETEPDDGLFAKSEGESSELTCHDAITDEGLAHFANAYKGKKICKEDLFYYIYGLLHSPTFRKRFKNNLAKQLPRIPAVNKYEDFKSFSDAGRALAELHVNYENADPYPVTIKQGDLRTAVIDDPKEFYRVKKWSFGKMGKEKDKTTVVYNSNITMQNVPLEAYDYIVNGKSALEWVMARQVVSIDKHNPSKNKGSDIVNDANDYANETMGNPAYPLELFQRVITVSLETMKIVRNLPKLDID